MIEVYLIIYGNSLDPTATWVGPMDSMSSARTLNEKISGKGHIGTVDVKFSSLNASRIISPSDYRKGLSLEP